APWSQGRRTPQSPAREQNEDRRTAPPLRRPRLASRPQQRTRFCSRSTPCFTLTDARGYLRPTSASDAHAASRSPRAASDCPNRNSESGALAAVSYLVETLRKISAASR